VKPGPEVAGRRFDHDRSIGSEGEQLQRGRIGPMEVVKHHQQRPVGRSSQQVSRHAIEQPEADLLGVGREASRRPAIGDSGQLRNQAGDFAGARAAGRAADAGPQHLHPRPEGGRTRPLPASTPDDQDATSGRLGSQLLSQTSLADTRLAGQQQQTTPAGNRLVKGRPQLHEVAFATNQQPGRRPQPGLRAAALPHCSNRPPLGQPPAPSVGRARRGDRFRDPSRRRWRWAWRSSCRSGRKAQGLVLSLTRSAPDRCCRRSAGSYCRSVAWCRGPGPEKPARPNAAQKQRACPAA
jgi:hypothetical protein